MNPLLVKAGVQAAKSPTGRKVIIGALVLGAVTSPFGIAVVMMMMMLSSNASGDVDARTMPVACDVALPGGVVSSTGLTQRQMENAATIIEVGKRLNVPPRGWVVAIATARQESALLNLASLANPGSLMYPHDTYADGSTPDGDHDSVGIVQQRDSWGSMADRMDVAKSIRMFYLGGDPSHGDGYSEPGLLDIPGWQDMSIAEAAQSVQVSKYPSAYAQWEALAVATVKTLADVDLTSSCASVATGPWTLPTTGYTISSVFLGGWRSTGGHSGTDFAAPIGTPIYAASTGVVETVGWDDSYGNLTVVRHADGVQTYYAHQSTQTVKVGDRVKPGDTIGQVGATGNVTGPHLHFEVRLNDKPIDPVAFLQERDVNP